MHRFLLLFLVFAGCADSERDAPTPAETFTLPCGSTDNAPTPGEMVAFESAGAGTILTIDQGSPQGVTTGWGGVLLDGAGKPLPDGGFCVESVGPRTSSGRIARAFASVKAGGTKVLLYPP
jgi:hypothetical protein